MYINKEEECVVTLSFGCPSLGFMLFSSQIDSQQVATKSDDQNLGSVKTTLQRPSLLNMKISESLVSSETHYQNMQKIRSASTQNIQENFYDKVQNCIILCPPNNNQSNNTKNNSGFQLSENSLEDLSNTCKRNYQRYKGQRINILTMDEKMNKKLASITGKVFVSDYKKNIQFNKQEILNQIQILLSCDTERAKQQYKKILTNISSKQKRGRCFTEQKLCSLILPPNYSPDCMKIVNFLNKNFFSKYMDTIDQKKNGEQQKAKYRELHQYLKKYLEINQTNIHNYINNGQK